MDQGPRIQYLKCSVAQLCRILCNPMDCSTAGFPVHALQELAQTQVHWVDDAIQQSYPRLCPSPTFIFFHNMVFSDESVIRITQPKHWSFSFSISPSNEYAGEIYFRIDMCLCAAFSHQLGQLHSTSHAGLIHCLCTNMHVYTKHPWEETCPYAEVQVFFSRNMNFGKHSNFYAHMCTDIWVYTVTSLRGNLSICRSTSFLFQEHEFG